MNLKKLSRVADSTVSFPYYGDMSVQNEWEADPTVTGKTALPEYKKTLALFKRVCESSGGRAYSWNKGIGWTALFVSSDDALNAKRDLISKGLDVLNIYKNVKAFDVYTEKVDNRAGDTEYEKYLRWDALHNASSAPFVLVLSNSALDGNEELNEYWLRSGYEVF